MTPVSIEGQRGPITITVVEQFGQYKVMYDNGGTAGLATGSSLESALGKAAGENAPDNYILHCASILRGIMQRAKGAQ